jgi:hypothetical protein
MGLPLLSRLASNSCLSLLSAGITGVCHHTWLKLSLQGHIINILAFTVHMVFVQLLPSATVGQKWLLTTREWMGMVVFPQHFIYKSSGGPDVARELQFANP